MSGAAFGACAAALLLVDEDPVEFRAIDADAATDEAPLPAHVTMQLRDNLDRARQDRIFTAGVAVPRVDGNHLEWSAPWPTPACILRCYVPERAASARVRLRIADVLIEGGDFSDLPVISICATAFMSGANFERPPTSLEAWTIELEDGTERAGLRYGTDDDQEIVLPVFGAQRFEPGWVGVAIWIASNTRGEDLESGEVTAAQSPWRVQIDNSAQDLNVPHRVIGIWERDDDQVDYASFTHAIGLAEQTGTVGVDPVWLTVVPPIVLLDPSVAALQMRYELWPLGYVQVWSAILEVVPAGPRVSGRDVYASNANAAGAYAQGLVRAAGQITRSRVPTWGGCPVVPRGEAVPALGWYVGVKVDSDPTYVDYDPPTSVEADRVPLGSVLIPAADETDHPQPDQRGYTACVDIITWSNEPDAWAAPAPTLFVRLAAYTPGDPDPQAASDWTPVSHEWSLGIVHQAAGPFEPVVVGAQAYARSGAWRWAGMLMGPPADVGATLRRVQTIAVVWDWQDADSGAGEEGAGALPTVTAPAVTYPLDLRVELMLQANDYAGPARFNALAYCAIASLERAVIGERVVS